jgi:hypothetical protein
MLEIGEEEKREQQRDRERAFILRLNNLLGSTVAKGGRRFGRWLSRLIRLVNLLLSECSR